MDTDERLEMVCDLIVSIMWINHANEQSFWESDAELDWSEPIHCYMDFLTKLRKW